MAFHLKPLKISFSLLKGWNLIVIFSENNLLYFQNIQIASYMFRIYTLGPMGPLGPLGPMGPWGLGPLVAARARARPGAHLKTDFQKVVKKMQTAADIPQ